MIADSSKPNKLRNVYTIRSHFKHDEERPHPKTENYYIKIKVIALIINLGETTERCKSKKGASVSEILA